MLNRIWVCTETCLRVPTLFTMLMWWKKKSSLPVWCTQCKLSRWKTETPTCWVQKLKLKRELIYMEYLFDSLFLNYRKCNEQHSPHILICNRLLMLAVKIQGTWLEKHLHLQLYHYIHIRSDKVVYSCRKSCIVCELWTKISKNCGNYSQSGRWMKTFH